MLDYVALGILIFAFVTVFYGIIVIHDIPYEISVHRNHPHQDAIHYAGWISLLFMGAIWPFLWIWATLYREDRGWGFIKDDDGVMHGQTLHEHLASLEARLEQLEQSADLSNPDNSAPDNSAPENSAPENKGSEHNEGEPR